MMRNTIPDPFDISECNRRNHNAMLNTATGRWLAAACVEIESLRWRIVQLEKLNAGVGQERDAAIAAASQKEPPE